MRKFLLSIALLFTAAGAWAAQSAYVASSFIGYDLLRAVIGTRADVVMLTKPGTDPHAWAPTPRDIKTVANAPILVYVGADDTPSIKKLLASAPKQPRVVRLMDFVQTLPVIGVDGKPGDEPDEHIWTSPANYVKLINAVAHAVATQDPANAAYYEARAVRYVEQVQKLDRDFRKIVDEGKRKTIVVGDRFALLYFVHEFGLSWLSPYPGCTEEAQASAEAIAHTADEVKKNKYPVVFKEELTSDRIAHTIAAADGAKVRVFWSGHNVTARDYENGETYVTMMRRNLPVLREALN